MGKAAIFLDRDGVINVEKDYVYTIDEFEFVENAIEALKILQNKGYALVVVTNQSGIARGYYTEEDFLTTKKNLLLKKYEAYTNTIQLLNHEISNIHLIKSFHTVLKENVDSSEDAILKAMNTLRTVFKAKLMEYAWCLDENWIDDVNEIDFNQSGGYLDIFVYNAKGELIEEKCLSIEL